MIQSMKLQLFKTDIRQKSRKNEKEEAKDRLKKPKSVTNNSPKKFRLKESQQTVEEKLKTLHFSLFLPHYYLAK